MQKCKELTSQFLEELRGISGDRVIVGSEVNPDYAQDEMPIYGTQMPQASIDVLTTEEIAAMTGVAPGTVRSRLSRARERLRKLLSDT